MLGIVTGKEHNRRDFSHLQVCIKSHLCRGVDFWNNLFSNVHLKKIYILWVVCHWCIEFNNSTLTSVLDDLFTYSIKCNSAVSGVKLSMF